MKVEWKVNGPNGALCALLDRVFYAGSCYGRLFKGKPFAAVATPYGEDILRILAKNMAEMLGKCSVKKDRILVGEKNEH